MRQWLIIDLEATTEEGGWPVEDMEIIEIGASLVAADGHELEHFQRFVRPLRRPWSISPRSTSAASRPTNMGRWSRPATRRTRADREQRSQTAMAPEARTAARVRGSLKAPPPVASTTGGPARMRAITRRSPSRKCASP